MADVCDYYLELALFSWETFLGKEVDIVTVLYIGQLYYYWYYFNY